MFKIPKHGKSYRDVEGILMKLKERGYMHVIHYGNVAVVDNVKTDQ